MEYTVVTAQGTDRLAELVNIKINEGWFPIGGVGVGTFPDPNNATVTIIAVCQAMTRDKA